MGAPNSCLLIEQMMDSLHGDCGSGSSLPAWTLRKFERLEGTESCQLLAQGPSPTVRATGVGRLSNLMPNIIKVRGSTKGMKALDAAEGVGGGT